jgi:hypothetical protein
LRAADERARHWADHLQRDGGGDRRRDVFTKGRDFAAWLGLVPKQISTGDRTILGKISRRGNRYLRVLTVNEIARALISMIARSTTLQSKAGYIDARPLTPARRKPLATHLPAVSYKQRFLCFSFASGFLTSLIERVLRR